VALRAEVVDFVRPEIMKQRGKRTTIGQVGVVEKEFGACLVKVLIDVVEPVCVKT
jgi:hypothetical protein